MAEDDPRGEGIDLEGIKATTLTAALVALAFASVPFGVGYHMFSWIPK